MQDCISRQAAIDLFPNDALEWDTVDGYIAPHVARRLIEYLPSAQRTGKWIYRDDDFDFYDTYTCSECDGEIMVDAERHYDMGMVIEDMKYCPHCGAKMDGKE